jgi:hypothetical protein
MSTVPGMRVRVSSARRVFVDKVTFGAMKEVPTKGRIRIVPLVVLLTLATTRVGMEAWVVALLESGVEAFILTPTIWRRNGVLSAGSSVP